MRGGHCSAESDEAGEPSTQASEWSFVPVPVVDSGEQLCPPALRVEPLLSPLRAVAGIGRQCHVELFVRVYIPWPVRTVISAGRNEVGLRRNWIRLSPLLSLITQPRSSPRSSSATASAPLSSLPPTSPTSSPTSLLRPLYIARLSFYIVRLCIAFANALKLQTISRVAFRQRHRASRRARTISASNLL